MTVLGKRPGEDVPERISRYSSYFKKRLSINITVIGRLFNAILRRVREFII